MVALGTLISATWILASNSWMQTPQGHEIINGDPWTAQHDGLHGGKGALHALARQSSSELAGQGIAVNALAPGYIHTELTRVLQQDAQFDEWLCKATPVGRWGTTDDMRSAVLLLGACESGFFTGQILTVDGGLTACF